jgi:hypothetical protein
MSTVSRRSLLRSCAVLPLLARCSYGTAAASGLESLGATPTRDSASIGASPLSVGYECLDRYLFQSEKTYDAAAHLGVKWARVQTGWSRCELEKGKFNFQWLDGIVDSLIRGGIRPWFNLGYGNKLYSPESPLISAVGYAPLITAEAREAWVRFVRNIADHYRTRVTHWEIWNEPNGRPFWKPESPSADHYVDLVKLSVPLIRDAVPGAVIIGGAIAGGVRPDSFDYLERALDDGLARYCDRLSFHPYRPNPDTDYDSDVRALRGLLARYKPELPLWQGECGCPSHNGGVAALSELDWNETRQAKWLLRRVMGDLHMRLELSSWFEISDLANYVEGTKVKGGTAYFGLLRRDDYTPKPSYFAYQCLCALFDADTARVDLPFHCVPADSHPAFAPEAIRTSTFERKGRPLFAFWYPSSFTSDFTPSSVSVLLRGGSAEGLSEPILIDPLERRAYRPAEVERKGRFWSVSVPLTDYPLILTDKALLAQSN